VLGLAKILSEC